MSEPGQGAADLFATDPTPDHLNYRSSACLQLPQQFVAIQASGTSSAFKKLMHKLVAFL
jgi:hypothetical protein